MRPDCLRGDADRELEHIRGLIQHLTERPQADHYAYLAITPAGDHRTRLSEAGVDMGLLVRILSGWADKREKSSPNT